MSAGYKFETTEQLDLPHAELISDHDMVITDSDIKPNYSFSKPRKIYKFAKAIWDEIKKICTQISHSVSEQAKSGKNVETLWASFKEKLLASIDTHVPSKMSRSKKKRTYPG